MPQTQVFQCPSCGANLIYDGGANINITCQFCGTSVIVPNELRSMSPGSQGYNQKSGAELSGNFADRIKKVLSDVETLGRDNVDDPDILELLKMQVSELITQDGQKAGGSRAAQLTELLRLASSGKKPEAENLFRQAFPTMNIAETELAVAILSGGSIE